MQEQKIPNPKFQFTNKSKIQNLNDQKLITTVRLGLFTIIGGLFVWFFINDLNPSGILSVSYDLCNPSPYISEFSPQGRVLDIEPYDGYCTQRMVIDPVYLDVRLPQRYDSATIALMYQKPDAQSLKAGPWASETQWQWALDELQEVMGADAAWRIGVAQFDVRDTPLDRRRVRFMLSSPGLAARGEEIIIREIKFVFEKQPLNWRMMKRWLASFVWK